MLNKVPDETLPAALQTYKFFGPNSNSCWPGYFKFSHNLTLCRSIAVDIAIELYLAILGQPVNHEKLRIVGLSQGGTIALLLTDVIKVGARKYIHEYDFSGIDPDVIAGQEKFVADNTIKTVELITVGTGVFYENNVIMEHNLTDPNPIVAKHLHLFSDGDWAAIADPGLVSNYWQGLPSKDASPASFNGCLLCHKRFVFFSNMLCDIFACFSEEKNLYYVWVKFMRFAELKH